MNPPKILTRGAVVMALLLMGAVALPLTAGATPVVDQSPTITAVTGTGGDVTVTWTNAAPDATSIDVILYDQFGDVITDDNVAPTTTTDTFTGVPDGGGYTVDVIANTPGGSLDPGGSDPFDLYLGGYVVDQSPTITAVTGTGGDVTVTWTNDAPDATSIDVILYDQFGDVITDDNVAPATTTDTFTGVPDGGGYTVDVIANTPGGSLDPGGSDPFDLYLGSYVVDQSPTITAVTGTGGDVTVTWTNAAPDATSIDVILYDQFGDVITDDNVAPATTTDTFTGVPDGGGYTVDVIANTPGGSLDPGGSDPFDLYLGSYVVDQSPTITAVTGTGGDVTVTWTNAAPDATSIDVILYDQFGDVITDDNVAPTTTTDTFTGVPDGDGYTVDVIANTPGGALDPGGSAPFDLSSGGYSSDQPPTITAVTGTGGDVTVTWTANAADATGYDVLLRDDSGAIVAEDSLGSAATSATFTGVADGGDYTVKIVAHTPIGDFPATSAPFDVVNGAVVPTPRIFPGGLVNPIVVPADTVTLTPIDGGADGWTVSWPELAGAPTDGQYIVTDDQGDTCTAQPTGVAGTILTCTLPARADGSTTLTGLVVTFQPDLIFYASATATNGGSPTARTPAPSPGDKVTTHPTDPRGSLPPIDTPTGPVVAAVAGGGFGAGWWTLIGATAVLGALALAWRRRRARLLPATVRARDTDPTR